MIWVQVAKEQKCSLLTAQELERQGIPQTANLPGGYEHWWAPSLIKRPWNKRINMGEDTREDFQHIHASAYVQAHMHKSYTLHMHTHEKGERNYTVTSVNTEKCVWQIIQT